MFGTIRKHQTWLWAVIITLTIISFVIFFSPYSKINSDRQSANYGSINGQRVSEQQYVNALREVHLQHFFMTGRWPDDDKRANFDPMRETYQWLLLTQKQEQLGIHPGVDVQEQLARNMVRAFDRSGNTSPLKFIETVLVPHGMSVSDFERFVRHYAGIQQLIATAGLSGKLIPPQEVKSLYERENQEVATSAVFFNPSNYLAGITVTPEVLGQFYSNRLANYRIPERVQVSYVKFNVTNFLAQAQEQLKTNLTDMVNENYQRYGTNLFPEAKTPEEAKAKLREEILRRQALTDARRKALEFANVLFDKKVMRAEDLQTQAKASGLPVAVSAPFTREEGPTDMEVGPEFAKAAFSLTTDEPFGGPVVGSDAVYVFALDKRVPSEIPPLDKIRDRVTADYKYFQGMMQAQRAGMAFYQMATNGLAHGKSFAEIATEAKVKAQQLPPFSIATQQLPGLDEEVNLVQLKQAAFSTPVKKVSNFQPTREGGFVLYVSDKLPLDVAKMNADLPDFTKFIRNRRQQEAFNLWLNKEAEKGLRDTPLARPQTPPNMGPASKAARS